MSRLRRAPLCSPADWLACIRVESPRIWVKAAAGKTTAAALERAPATEGRRRLDGPDCGMLLFGFFCVSTLMLARGDFPFAVFTGACILILYYTKRRYMRKTAWLQEGIREDFPT